MIQHGSHGPDLLLLPGRKVKAEVNIPLKLPMIVYHI